MKVMLTSVAAIAMMICAAVTASAAVRCGSNEVYSSSMRQCIPTTGPWFIKGGCPYNLDKECHRGPRGRIICRCVS
jgi:hypothetical protein